MGHEVVEIYSDNGISGSQRQGQTSGFTGS